MHASDKAVRQQGRPSWWDKALVRIGVDGRYQGGPITGVPRYIDELCKQLDVLLPHAQFFLYAATAEGIRVPSERWNIRVESVPRFARLSPNIWWKLFAHRLIAQDSLDVLWAAAGLLPRKVMGVPCVLTVYDLTFRLFPRTMSRPNLWAHRIFFRRDLNRAEKVVAISEGTSLRLNQYYGRLADAVVRPAVSEQFCPQPIEKRNEIRAKYKLDRPFLLAVSTLEPRKNLLNLVEAFLHLRRAGRLPNHELVLIGKRGWRESALASAIAADEARSIRTLGYVPDEALPALYSACAVFCMPSLYEGFGMPVLEARHCDAPVVTTDIPELREAGDASCVYVLPDARSIAEGVLRAVAGRSNPKARADSSSWRNEAEKLVHLMAKESWSK